MTPKEMRALAEIGPAMETGEYYNVDSRIQDATSALRAAADEVDRLRAVIENAPQVPIFLTVNELDSLPEGTVVVGTNGLIWQRDLVGYPANGRLAWFPLEQEVGSGSDAVGNGARVILAAQRGNSFE